MALKKREFTPESGTGSVDTYAIVAATFFTAGAPFQAMAVVDFLQTDTTSYGTGCDYYAHTGQTYT